MPGTRAAVQPRSWFKDTFGFTEAVDDVTRSRIQLTGDGFENEATVFEATRKQFSFEDGVLTSLANGKQFRAGAFTVAALSDLQSNLAQAVAEAGLKHESLGGLRFQNVVACTRDLIGNAANDGAVFQVASLFNCLETMNGNPEAGVTRYSTLPIQGAACALACPGSLVYRNYFLNGRGQAGQKQQLDCLAAAGDLLKDSQQCYWKIRNGLMVPALSGSVAKLSARIATEHGLGDRIRSKIQVGVHWDAEVWTGTHGVCQVFCGAVPLSLVKTSSAESCAPLACVVLEAAYDATLAVAACLAAQRCARVKVFLTLVGGGFCSNRLNWIADALSRALVAYADQPLDVCLVHYGQLPNDRLATLGTDTGTAGGLKVPKRAQTAPVHRPVTPMATKEETIEVDPDLLAMAGGTAKTLIAAFDRFDVNGDGVIDKSEFMRVLQAVNPAFFTLRIINMLLAEADVDGDGVVHYAEFVEWLTGEAPEIVQGVLSTAK